MAQATQASSIQAPTRARDWLHAQGSGMAHTICQLLSAHRDEPIIHSRHCWKSPSLLWHYKLYSQSQTHIPWRHSRHQKHPQWVHPHQEVRDKMRGGEVRETRSISHCISWIWCFYLQGPAKGRGKRAWCRACSSTAHSSHSGRSHSCGHQRSRKSNFCPILWVKMEELGEQRLLLIPICWKEAAAVLRGFPASYADLLRILMVVYQPKHSIERARCVPSKHGVNVISA